VAEVELLRRALQCFTEGYEAEQGGELGRAAELYRAAAHHLLQAAKLAKGGVKRARVEGAELLASRAEELAKRAMGSSSSALGARAEEGLKLLSELGLTVARGLGVSLSDVAGLDDVKREVEVKVILPLRYPREAERFGLRVGGGILLYGPPGTGKTFLAKALSCEAGASFIPVNPSSLVSQWFGEFEKNISKLFRAARLLAPSVVFIDEVDALAPRRRGLSSSVMKRAVPQLLLELDSMVSCRDHVVVLAATNAPWDLDEALLRPGRLDERIYVPPPDEPARLKIFQLHLRGRPLGDDVDLAELARLSEGYSGADIAYVCRKAAESAFLRAVKGGEHSSITMDDLVNALKAVPPSINPSLLKRYEDFKAKMRLVA